MPWWSWILIWTGLVLVLLGVLALCAWWLFGKAKALGVELERLNELLAEFEARADALVAAAEPSTSAILRGRDAVAAERRSLRRVIDRRKDERRAARLERGKLLTTADPMQYAFLARRK